MITMIPVLLLLTVTLLTRNFLKHKSKETQISRKELKMSESSTVQGIISESADNIVNVVSRAKKLYADFSMRFLHISQFPVTSKLTFSVFLFCATRTKGLISK